MRRRLAGRSLVLTVLMATSCSGAPDQPATAPTTTRPEVNTSVIAPATTQAPPSGQTGLGPHPDALVPLTTLPSVADVCGSLQTVTITGTVSDERLTEISGAAASRRHAGVLWVHNDSGSLPAVHAIAATGEVLGTQTLAGVLPLDWEDIAIGPGPEPGRDYLYIGDIGDNLAFRPGIEVFRIPEPDPFGDGVAESVDVIRLTYPESGVDAEALAVDPVTGDLLIVAKTDDGTPTVYLGAAAEFQAGSVTQLRPIATLDLGVRGQATAADISPNGDRIAVRGYGELWVWPRSDADLGIVLGGQPCLGTSPEEVQGEAMSFAADGATIFTLSEGAGPDVHHVTGP